MILYNFQPTTHQQNTFLQGGQFRISPQTLQAHPLVSQDAPRYYENSSEIIKRINLTENIDQRQIHTQLIPSSSSKTSNYVTMNPVQFLSNSSFKGFGENNEEEEELLPPKVLPLIPFDPTHNVSACGSSRLCHDYEAIDPIR